MPQHAQSQPDAAQLIAAAAAAIKAGQPLDDMQRMQAAGYAAEKAVEDGNVAPLDLIILVGAGDFNAALHKLVDMSTQGSPQTTAPRSPFAGLTNPTPTPATQPAPTPVAPATPTPTPTPTPRPRRR